MNLTQHYSNLKLRYTMYAMDSASKNGHIHILNWWKQSNLKLEYSSNAMNWASKNGAAHAARK